MGPTRAPQPRGRRWLRALPAALILVVFALDFLTPRGMRVFPLLAAAPVLVAPWLSLAGTIATGGAALLAAVLLPLVRGRLPFGVDDIVPFSTFVTLTLLAAVVNRLLARERRQLRNTREVAEVLQRAVLPSPPGRIGPLTVAVRYEAAAREAAVGGDLYAIHPTSHGVRLMIADVRGKGLGAVRTVNALLGTFHEATRRAPDLPGVVRWLEERMQEVKRAEGGAGLETFATAVIAELSADGSTLCTANRGHPAPLLVHRGRARPLEPATPSLPLGLADLGVPDVPPDVPVDRYALPEGAVLVLFTDGVVEARDRRGVFYDPVPRLSRPLPPDPDHVLDALLGDLYRYTEEHLDDDVALLAVGLSRNAHDGPGGAPAVRPGEADGGRHPVRDPSGPSA
ncbi:PP2C family protein-serine/threonine phosphatase [Streptomyces prasinopilosus]|uniref:PP2C family protein-serine/threonine phosphatase n=1 Tax=Streptomyces prasinopilosus TaxID=67344 RepID=UPI0006EB5B85|nr:PP2C family protein-serine/threonine phosphatase [Streptomyces prasinopilosus]